MHIFFSNSLVVPVQRVENYEYELPSDFEDEEVEEDEAFNSEDERKFGHLFARKSGGSDASESDEDEDDAATGEEEEEDNDADLLNSDEDSQEEEEEDSGLEEAFGPLESGGGDDDGDEDEEAGFDNEDDIEYDEAAHEAMVRAVTGGAGTRAKDRRRKKEVVLTEAYPESEYNLPSTGQSVSMYFMYLFT